MPVLNAQPDPSPAESLDAAYRWATQLHGDVVLMPFVDGQPDWSTTRRGLEKHDGSDEIDPADIPRLAVLTDSFERISPDVPMATGVSVISWWDENGAEHVKAIEGTPAYAAICEGIIKRSIATGWRVFYRKTPAKPRLSEGLPVVDLADWEGRTIPPRESFVEGLIPSRNVTLLSGDGGLGKSLLALQIGVASTLGHATLGLRPKAGKVLYIGAEDEAEEFHRRVDDILRDQGATYADTGGRFKLLALADRDALLAVPGRTGALEPTPLFGQVAELVGEHQPDLIVLDTAADMFGGDEIKRGQVRQFIAMLRSIALQADCAILLLAHPSVAGMQTGTGTSGSTAWNNSVRSRLYLTAVADDDDARVLTNMKSNYGRKGTKISMRWRDGVFVLDDGRPSPAAGLMDHHADEVFLELLSLFNRTGQSVSPNPSVSYAPKVMQAHPDSRGLTKKALEQAMHRLLKSGHIRTIKEGPPTRQRSRLWVSAEDFGGDEPADEVTE